MRENFDIIYDRKNTDSVKWDCADRFFQGAEVLPMWVADMDFQAPREVTEAIRLRNEQGIYGYTESMPESFRAAFANWVQRRHGWAVRPEWLCHTPGVVPALYTAVIAFTEPGDRIMIQPPVYPPFCSIIRENGRQPVLNPLKIEGGRYVMDFDDMERQMKSGVKMLILCSPHNPVGRVWERDELLHLGRLCLENDVLLVSDEIHADIVFAGRRHLPAASLSRLIEQKSITCMAASKTFGLAGLITSTAIIPNPQLMARFHHQLQVMGLDSGNVFGITASLAAYRHGEEWLEQLLKYLAGNLLFLKDFLAEHIPQIEFILPEGTYLVWLDCRKLGLSPRNLSAMLTEKAKIGLNEGTAFGCEGAGFQRINIACPRSILQECLQRLERAVRSESGQQVQSRQ
ncbi:MAG TPA: cystathionine beta-lyase [Clostridiales bacterium]|nr:cystathionine beta-lyase [Clostridiales bacterium]